MLRSGHSAPRRKMARRGVAMPRNTRVGRDAKWRSERVRCCGSRDFTGNPVAVGRAPHGECSVCGRSGDRDMMPFHRRETYRSGILRPRSGNSRLQSGCGGRGLMVFPHRRRGSGESEMPCRSVRNHRMPVHPGCGNVSGGPEIGKRGDTEFRKDKDGGSEMPERRFCPPLPVRKAGILCVLLQRGGLPALT